MVFYSLTYIANSLCMVSKDTNINDLREKDSGYIKCLLFGLANYINLLKFNRFYVCLKYVNAIFDQIPGYLYSFNLTLINLSFRS